MDMNTSKVEETPVNANEAEETQATEAAELEQDDPQTNEAQPDNSGTETLANEEE